MGLQAKTASERAPARGRAEPVSQAISVPAFVDNRPQAVAMRKLSDMMNGSAAVAAQRRLAQAMHEGPRMMAQRTLNEGMSVRPVQRQEESMDDELLQARFAPVQRAGNVQGTQSVVQREVEHDGTSYSGNGDRGRWRAALKRAVIKEYNQRTGATLTECDNLTDEDLDRCHKVSFNDIEDLVVSYLNGGVSDTDFIQITNSLSNPTQYKEIGKWRSFMMSQKKTGASPAMIVQSANKLLGILNSSIANVMLGNASTNRSIQAKLDLHFQETSSGEYSLTPLSRNLATSFVGYTSGVPYSPGGQHISSSSSGNVPVGSLTPLTSNIIKKH